MDFFVAKSKILIVANGFFILLPDFGCCSFTKVWKYIDYQLFASSLAFVHSDYLFVVFIFDLILSDYQES